MMHVSSLTTSMVSNQRMDPNDSEHTMAGPLIKDTSLNDVHERWNESSKHDTDTWDERAITDPTEEEMRFMYDYKVKLSEAALSSIHKNTRDIRASHEHLKLEAVIIKELIQHSKKRIDKVMMFCGMQILLIFVIFILQTIFLIANSFDRRKY